MECFNKISSQRHQEISDSRGLLVVCLLLLSTPSTIDMKGPIIVRNGGAGQNLPVAASQRQTPHRTTGTSARKPKVKKTPGTYASKKRKIKRNRGFSAAQTGGSRKSGRRSFYDVPFWHG